MKKQNLDFKIARNLFIEKKYYTIQIWKKCRHIKFCDLRNKSCSQDVLFTIMRLLSRCTTLYYCFFWKKLLLLACFAVSKYEVFIWIVGFQWQMQVHRYEFIYKITEDHSVAVNQMKNRLQVVGFGQLYLAGSFENFSFCIFPHFPAVINNRRN